MNLTGKIPPGAKNWRPRLEGSNRKRSDSDPDFEDGDHWSDDNQDGDDIPDEDQQVLTLDDWRKTNFGDLKVFYTINLIPQGAYMTTVRKFSICHQISYLNKGPHVNFAKELKKNPFAPTAVDLVNFGSLLRRYGDRSIDVKNVQGRRTASCLKHAC